jgi:hypothetical protein
MRDLRQAAGEFPLNSFSQKTACCDKKNLSTESADGSSALSAGSAKQTFY